MSKIHVTFDVPDDVCDTCQFFEVFREDDCDLGSFSPSYAYHCVLFDEVIGSDKKGIGPRRCSKCKSNETKSLGN
jgi:hypothetical protein